LRYFHPKSKKNAFIALILTTLQTTMAQHLDLSSQPIPSSTSYEKGKFGRIFPWLPPCQEDTPQSRIDMFQIAQLMFEVKGEASEMPVGYTYLGQFLIHDISFDPTSINERSVDPEFLWNFRTPAIDLDSVYGGGPGLNSYLYTTDGKHALFWLPEPKRYEKDPTFYDLPRISPPTNYTALIADPRNDENVIISQLHAAFLLFHNNTIKRLGKEGKYDCQPDLLFRSAQQFVKWCFQWVVLNDYLPRIIDISGWDEANNQNYNEPNIVPPYMKAKIFLKDIAKNIIKRKYFDWRNEPFIPLEFSAAAFRFGHSQVLSQYQFNKDPSMGDNPSDSKKDLFSSTKESPFRVDMELFFSSVGDKNKTIGPYLSNNLRRLPTHPNRMGNLSNGLSELLKEISTIKAKLDKKLDEDVAKKNIGSILDNILDGLNLSDGSPEIRRFLLDASMKINERNLAEMNLIRGLKLRLPSGQCVAKAMGLKTVTVKTDGFPDHLRNNTPLWYYILYESKVINDGHKLGPVGSRIVAEVIIGLLQGDKTSFLNQDPNWVPHIKNQKGEQVDFPDFNMVDLLQLAGVIKGPLSELVQSNPS